MMGQHTAWPASTTSVVASGHRAIDLLIAATVQAQDMPLFTCDPPDFEGLDSLIGIVSVDRA
jgi:predicted nucleic acid-binding protein